MSDTPNDQSGDGNTDGQRQGGQPQGGQPQGGQPQGGQPQGGQPQGGQPQGGQPQGGQPQGGQPQGGQPQGGQPQGRPPQGGQPQMGPSVGDIFSRPATKGEIQIGIAVFALIGVGLGLGILLTGSLSDAGQLFAALALLGSLALGAPIAGVLALRQADELENEPDNLRYATAGVTGFVGTLAMYIIVFVFAIIGLPTTGGTSFTGAPEIGDILLPILVISLGAAATAAGVVWAVDNLGASGTPSSGTAGNPPR